MRVLTSILFGAMLVACGHHSAATSDGGGGGGGGDGGAIADGGGDGGEPLGVDVTVTLVDRPTNAATFTFLTAYQDGSAPWQAAPAPVGDSYEFTVHSAVWGFAWTCIPPAAQGGATPTPDVRVVQVARFAVAERASLTITVPAACTDRVSRVALTGTVTTPAPGGGTLVQFGAASGLVNATTGAYRILTAPGTHDLFALHGAGAGNGTGSIAADLIAVDRGVAVAGATTHDLDFTTAKPPQTYPVTVTSAGTSKVTASTVLYSAGATSVGLVTSTNPPYTSSALAASQMTSGDLYAQIVTITGSGQTAVLTNVTATPAAESVTEPAALGGATASVPTTMPYPEIKTTWNGYANAVGYAWQASQQLPVAQCGAGAQGPCQVRWTALLSPGVLGASPQYQMPDLSQLPGWTTKLQLVSGVNATGAVEAETSSAGAGDFPPASPAAAGTQRVQVAAAYTATP